jgi:hypothetical protein
VNWFSVEWFLEDFSNWFAGSSAFGDRTGFIVVVCYPTTAWEEEVSD